MSWEEVIKIKDLLEEEPAPLTETQQALKFEAMSRLLDKHYSPPELEIAILEMMEKIKGK
tara:strand:+ start:1044 stop:1223 length:180 start_codon:yes stop_codon:yes gene_type:complete